MKKLIFASLVIAALLVVAMPVAAQGPSPYHWVFFDRTPEMGQAKAWLDGGGDPHGGWPLTTWGAKYVPDGKGGVAAKSDTAQCKPRPDFVGVAAWNCSAVPNGPQSILPGGVPSSASGDGSEFRKSIYIGGAWADPSVNPAQGQRFTWDPNTNDARRIEARYYSETPYEIPACATLAIPAGASKYFKLDTWKKGNQGDPLRTQIWLDDELDGAKKASGSAVFGAANKFFLGTSNFGDGWSVNYRRRGNQQDLNTINGYTMEIVPPEMLQPNYAYPAPNAMLYTGDCTSAVYAGVNCVKASSGGASVDNASSWDWSLNYNIRRFPDGNLTSSRPEMSAPNFEGISAWITSPYVGLANFNPNQPSHLLWYEGNFDGWVHLRVKNQMIWDGTVSVCSYRAETGKPATR